MVARGDIFWADLAPPAGRRPVCVLTRDAAIEVLNSVTCAPITRTTRGIASEVPVGPPEGLPQPCVINCDNVITVGKDRLDPQAVGRVDAATRASLDRALRFALDLRF